MGRVAETFGGVDILVNNAGISVLGAPEAIPFEDYQRAIAVNVTGVVVATQEALRHMGPGGRIIHIGSSMTHYGAFPTASIYTLTKSAVSGFTRGLVRDLGPRGITVNTVHPGPTDSDMNPADGPVADIVRLGIAVGRYGRGEDIAAAVAELGPRARAGSVAEAAAAEVVVLAVQWQHLAEAVADLPPWAGRIVIDATNPVI